MEQQTYNGFEISFEEKGELWVAVVDLDNGEKERVTDSSLKVLKTKLDLFKKKKFERMPVFVRATGRYRMGGGQDKAYEPQYTEAMVTSVSPDGNIYTVAKGKKTGEKHHISQWASRGTIVLDTPENRKMIAEIEKAGQAEWEAEKTQAELVAKLEYLNDKELYKQVYSKEFGK